MRVLGRVFLLGLTLLACGEEPAMRTMRMTGTVVSQTDGVVITGADVTLSAGHLATDFLTPERSFLPVESTEGTTSSQGAFDLTITAPESQFDSAVLAVSAPGYVDYESSVSYRSRREVFVRMVPLSGSRARSR